MRAGKLLGFIVKEESRSILLKKKRKKGRKEERKIREMPEPRTKKEVRGLLERLNYLSWFTSYLTATCEPIFRMLKRKIKRSGEIMIAKGHRKDKRKVAGTSGPDTSWGSSAR